jgi:predicted transcriptional regulator
LNELNIDYVVQIMPAAGWSAAMANSEEPYYWMEPLIAWGLVKHPREGTFVTGLGRSGGDGSILSLGDDSQFLGYFPTPENLRAVMEHLREQGRAYAVRSGWIKAEADEGQDLREVVEQGIADVEAGRVVPWDEAKKQLGLEGD